MWGGSRRLRCCFLVLVALLCVTVGTGQTSRTDRRQTRRVTNWQPLESPGSTFPARRSHCAVYLPSRQATLVFGGFGVVGQSAYGDVWEEVTLSRWWRQLELLHSVTSGDDSSANNIMPGVAEATCVHTRVVGVHGDVGDSVIVYGGRPSLDRLDSTGSVFELTPGSSDSTGSTVWWSDISPVTQAPPLRGHVAVSTLGIGNGGATMLVFGGITDDGLVSRELKLFSRPNNSRRGTPFTMATVSNDGRGWPHGRSFATGTRIGDWCLVFGGMGEHNDPLNDLWRLDMSAAIDRAHGVADDGGGTATNTNAVWTRLRSFSELPAARVFHTAGSLGSRLIVTGGRADSVGRFVFLTDVWEYDIDRERWELLPTGPSTPRLSHHASAMVGYEFVSYGGTEPDAPATSTTRRLDLTTLPLQWEQTVASGLAPSPRTGAVGIAIRSNFIIHGGFDGETSLSDMWQWSPVSERWALWAPGPPLRDHSATIWEDHLIVFGGVKPDGKKSDELWWCRPSNAADAWSQHPQTQPWPAPRSHASMAVSGAALVIFGGVDGNGKILNDLHVRMFDTLTIARFNADAMLLFDGKAGSVQLLDTSRSFPSFTIEFWMASRKEDSPYHQILRWHNVIAVMRHDTSAYVDAQLEEITPWQGLSNRQVFDGKWHHIAITFSEDHKRKRMLIDGVVDFDTPVQGSIADVPAGGRNIFLGASHNAENGFQPPLNGFMDNLRLWSVERSPEDIKRTMYLPLRVDDRLGLEGWWTFDTIVNSTMCPDLSGNGRHALISSSSHQDTLSSIPRVETTRPRSAVAPVSVARFLGPFTRRKSPYDNSLGMASATIGALANGLVVIFGGVRAHTDNLHAFAIDLTRPERPTWLHVATDDQDSTAILHALNGGQRGYVIVDKDVVVLDGVVATGVGGTATTRTVVGSVVRQTKTRDVDADATETVYLHFDTVDTPEMESRVHHVSAITDDGQAYVFGGRTRMGAVTNSLAVRHGTSIAGLQSTSAATALGEMPFTFPRSQGPTPSARYWPRIVQVAGLAQFYMTVDWYDAQAWSYDALSSRWSPAQPSTGDFPDDRDGFVLVAYHGGDPQFEGKFVFFGGESSAGFQNDVRVASLPEGVWTHVGVSHSSSHSQAVRPSPRIGSTAFSAGGRLYVHSGLEMDYYSTTPSDFWTFDLSTRMWTKLDSPLDAGGPSGRYEGSALYLPSRNLALFAFGEHIIDSNWESILRSDEAHVYNVATSTWTLVAATSARQPVGRRGAAMCVIEDRVLLFGGLSSRDPGYYGGDLNDLWSMDIRLPAIERWQWQPLSTSNGPSVRANSFLAAFQGGVWLYGGYSYYPTYTAYSDSYSFMPYDAFPAYTNVTGTGVNRGVAGAAASFVITSLDIFGQAQIGADCTDAFTARFVGQGGTASNVRFAASIQAQGGVGTPCSYTVSYTPFVAGQYQLDVAVLDNPIPGSPFYVNVAPGPLNVATSMVNGDGIANATAGARASFSVQTRDRFGNSAAAGEDVQARLQLQSKHGAIEQRQVVAVLDKLDGSYDASFTVTRSGGYLLQIAFTQKPGASLEFAPEVNPAEPQGRNSLVAGVINETKSGEINVINVYTVDRYGNNVTSGLGHSLISFQFYSVADDTDDADVTNADRRQQRRAAAVISSTIIKTSVVDHNTGRYSLTFFPFSAGAFAYTLEVAGQPVVGSPYALRVTPVFVRDSEAIRAFISSSVAGVIVLAIAGACFSFFLYYRVLRRTAALQAKDRSGIEAELHAIGVQTTSTPKGAMGRSIPETTTHDKDARSIVDELCADRRDGGDGVGHAVDGDVRTQTRAGLDMVETWLRLRAGYREVTIFLLWFALYLVVQFLQNDVERSFPVNASLRKFLDGYSDVTTVDNFWSYCSAVAARVFNGYSYGGAPLPPSELGFIQNYNKLVGGLLIVQRLADAKECSSAVYSNFFGQCKGAVSSTTFEGGRGGHSFTSDYDHDHEGHTLFFSVALSEAEVMSQIEEAHRARWIGRRTVQVSIKFASYNGEAGLFSFAEVAFAMSAGGTFEDAKLTVESARFELYTGTSDYIKVVLEGCLIFMIFYNVADELIDLHDTGPRDYVRSSWNIVDWLSLCLQVAYVVMRLRYVILIADHPIVLPSSQYEPIIEESASLSSSILFVNMLNIMITILRQIKYFDFQPRMAVISKTIQKSSMDLGHFMLLFSIMFMSFCMMALLLFGPHLGNFRNLGRTVQSMAEILLGEYDFAALHQVDAVMATLMFWGFVIAVFYMLVNIFLSIVIDAYAQQKHEMNIGASSIPRDLIEWIRMLAHGADSVEPLKQAMSHFLELGRSSVSADEVAVFLREVLKLKPKEVVAQLRVMADLPNDKVARITSENVIIEVFKSYDRSGKGYLTHREFKEFIRQADIGLTNDEIAAVIEALDINGNGVIEYDEFLRYVAVMFAKRFGNPAQVEGPVSSSPAEGDTVGSGGRGGGGSNYSDSDGLDVGGLSTGWVDHGEVGDKHATTGRGDHATTSRGDRHRDTWRLDGKFVDTRYLYRKDLADVEIENGNVPGSFDGDKLAPTTVVAAVVVEAAQNRGSRDSDEAQTFRSGGGDESNGSGSSSGQREWNGEQFEQRDANGDIQSVMC